MELPPWCKNGHVKHKVKFFNHVIDNCVGRFKRAIYKVHCICFDVMAFVVLRKLNKTSKACSTTTKYTESQVNQMYVIVFLLRIYKLISTTGKESG